MLNNKKKTIWIINQYASTPETGIGGRHFSLAKELAKQGYSVYLIAASYTHILRNPIEMNGQFQVESIADFSFVWVKVPVYKNAHDKNRIFNWFNFAWKLRKLPGILINRPDVIWYSSPSLVPFISAKYLAKKLKSKLLFEVRDIWPLTFVEVGGYSPKHPFVRLMQWIEDKAYFDADIVLSNLPNAAEHMESRGMRRDKFKWIPNGLDMQEMAVIHPLGEATLAALPKNKFIIGYTGTLGIANALDYFIDAASLLKEDSSLAWVIVGKGQEKKNLELKCQSLGLSNVYFINPIAKTQVQTMLGWFDVCYIGWKKEKIYHFGVAANKIPEYLYSGKPIIHSFSGHEDIIAKAKAGISVPAENSQAIADAVLTLKSMSPIQRKELGESGHQYAIENHDYEKLAEKLSSIL